MIRFTIPGPPQGKARPRVVTRGGYTHAYTPAKTAQYEALIREAYISSAKGQEAATGAVQLAIRAVYPIPKSWPKEKQKLALAGLIPVMVKPDLDNVIKCIMDSVNGIAWMDDKQVDWVQASKTYGPEPGVEVEIWQV